MKRLTTLPLQFLILGAARTVIAADPNGETLTLQNGQKQQTSQQTEVLHDIHGPLPTVEYPPSVMAAAIALLLLLLLGLLFFFIKKRKKPLPKAVPPWETALRELAEAHHLMAGGQSLAYMEQVGQILRRYIELRFAIRSTRQTTQEFFTGLPQTGTPSLVAYQAELRTCLELADMAKFAHLAADQDHIQQMEKAVHAFITSTRPEAQPSGGRP